MRRVSREGRSVTKSFSYPKSKDEMIEEIEMTARREGVYFSDIVLMGLEDYYKKHCKSKNPQTVIELFKTGLENAVPNLYEDSKKWVNFYNLIKKKPEFKKVDEQLNMILSLHHRKDKEFL